MSTAATNYGGSASAIAYHYDVGRAFYALWLDETLSYSCALWPDASAGGELRDAQLAKIRSHLDAARVQEGSNVLDIGCGWGALLQLACSERRAARATGLTLSHDQFDYVSALGLPHAEVRLEHWADHEPEAPYDSIVSVGAFEHFASPEDSDAKKIALYADFFRRCRDWLTPDGRMSLQTIAYGTMKRSEASAFINNEIFPSADLPTFEEIVKSTHDLFEITSVVNHRLHYARTLECWARNLARRREQAVHLVGEEVTSRYERYLKQSAIGFHMGKIGLLRVVLRPITGRWKHDARW